MPRVQRDAVRQRDGGVKGALHVVYALRHEAEPELRIPIEIVQQAVRVVEPVAERRVGRVGVHGDAERLPLVDVVVRDGRKVLPVGGVARRVGDDGHGLDADDALERQVRLVGQRAGKVVRADLVGRDQGLVNEVARPLL